MLLKEEVYSFYIKNKNQKKQQQIQDYGKCSQCLRSLAAFFFLKKFHEQFFILFMKT